MLVIFMQHPAWYFIPFGIVLVLLILGARYIPYTGEAKMLKAPTIIFAAALMWPVFVTFTFWGLVFLVAGRAIGYLIPKKK